MKTLFVAFALGMAVVGTAPASAAPNDSTERYAACLSQSRPAEVRQLLQSASASLADRPYRSLMDDTRCFAKVFGDQPYRPEDVFMSMDLMRGKLAERALLGASAQVAALQPLPLQQKRYIRPWFAATGRNAAVDEMGACMADTDPAGIMMLIKTDPGSNDENAAIGAMSASLTKCLSAGTRLEAGRQALRAALADALYQRLNNPSLSVVQK